MSSPHRVVVAPDKFRGTLTADEVGAHLRAGLLRIRPELEIDVAPIADGGEGTLDAAHRSGFELIPTAAHGPTGEPLTVAYARRDDVAIVELAAVSGIHRLPGGVLRPLDASSRGAGELLAAALDAGCRTLVLGVGGSSSTDGGAGLLRGLGARLYDGDGVELPEGGGCLDRLARLDLDGLHPGLRDAELILASDVDNALLGATGAAAIYGAQKGATPEQIDHLEGCLAHWADVVAATVGHGDPNVPGAGAAGGVGFAALVVLGARLVPGIEMVMRLVALERRIAGASLVITGEGSLDPQSIRGKATAGVAAAAARLGVPTIAVAGQSTLPPEAAERAGFAGVYPLTEWATSLEECFDRAAELVEDVGSSIAAEWFPVAAVRRS